MMKAYRALCMVSCIYIMAVTMHGVASATIGTARRLAFGTQVTPEKIPDWFPLLIVVPEPGGRYQGLLVRSGELAECKRQHPTVSFLVPDGAVQDLQGKLRACVDHDPYLHYAFRMKALGADKQSFYVRYPTTSEGFVIGRYTADKDGFHPSSFGFNHGMGMFFVGLGVGGLIMIGTAAGLTLRSVWRASKLGPFQRARPDSNA